MDITTIGIGVDTRKVKEAERDLKSLSNAGNKAERQTNSLSNSFKLLGGAISAYVGVHTVRNVIDLADSYTLLNNRIRLVTNSSQELTKVHEQLFEVAQDTRGEFTATAGLYSRVALFAKDYVKTQEDLLTVTEAVNNSILVSGTTTAEAAGGIIQLTQALGSGVLRGQELNSVMEQMPRLAQAISDSLGVPIGQFRKLAEQGAFTSDVILEAIKLQADVIKAEAQSMDLTVSQSILQMKNSLMEYVGEVNNSTGATTDLAKAISDLAKSPEFEIFIKASIGSVLELIRVMRTGTRVIKSFLETIGDTVAFTTAYWTERVTGTKEGLNAIVAEHNKAQNKIIEDNLNAVAEIQQGSELSEMSARLTGKQGLKVVTPDIVSKESIKDTKEYQERVKSLQEQFKKVQDEAEKTKETHKKVSQEIKRDAEDWTAGAKDAMRSYMDYSKDIATQTEKMFTNAFKSMEDSLVEFAKTGKFNFRDLANSIIDDMIRIEARQAISGILGGVGGVAPTIGSSFADFFGSPNTVSSSGDFSALAPSAPTFAGGGFTGNGARSGGIDGQGGFPAILHPRETVIDHAQGQSMGKTVNVYQTINIDSTTDKGVIMQAMNQAKEIAKAEILRSLNGGGEFAQAVGRA